jgi:SPP1 gp7 family putative phage head morphogenesis protein
MKWRAHELDGRISAKNALKIRAALRSSTKWERVFEAYKRTQPAVSKNPAQDRARARAWAMLSVPFDNDALIAALRRTWADGFALGIISADDAIRQARELKKADDPDYIDWANWKPGDAAAALLVKPTRAFQRLLEAQGATIRGIDRTGYDRLGTALADAIALGLSGRRAAKLIQDSVSDPARALTIAITETNRAISRATIERYQQFGLEQMEWVTSDPCDKCVLNEGKVVNVGATFPSGDTQPPVHPNCRCALLPVVPDFNAPANEIDNILLPQEPTIAGISERLLLDTSEEATQLLNNSPRGIGEERLTAAYKMRPEYNAFPDVIDPDEFDRLRDAKEGVAVYRGIVDGKGQSADYFIEQYKRGTHYAGYGMYGNGTYTSTNFGRALEYAKYDENKVMEILIPKDAKFITYAEMRDKTKNAINEIDAFIKSERSRMFDVASRIARATNLDITDVPEWQQWEKRQSNLFAARTLLSDEGTTAVLMGYDGVSLRVSDNEVYYIILNRGKVKIKR